MRAIRIHKFGGPEVLQLDEVSVPKAGPGELLVQVMAASVNPVDYKIRAGGYPNHGPMPLTMGRDLAGVVEAVGSGVPKFSIGDDVFALLGRDRGGYADFTIVKAEEAAKKPDALSDAVAAGLALAGLTAWQGLFDHGRLEAGQRVLIHGGAGGVGHLAVQFAKLRGAFVAVTGSEQDLDFLKGLGADQVIDYKSQRFEQEVQDIDLVFDLIGGETRDRSWDVLKGGGMLVSTLGAPDEAEASRRGVRSAGYMAQPNPAQLEEMAQLVESGKVEVKIQKTYPLAQAAEAQRAMETSHVQGKIVLTVGGTGAA